MYKVLLTKEINERALKILESVSEVVTSSSKSESILVKESKDVDGIIVGALGGESVTVGRAEKTESAMITPTIIKSASRLKVIGHAARPMPQGDVENVAVRAATKRGIIVLYVPQAYGHSIADYTFALLMAVARKIPEVNYALKYEGRWKLGNGYIGTDISFKTIGIVGFGRIGRMVAKRAKGFDMRVLAYDPYVPTRFADEIGAELVDLKTLLRFSDFVTIHVADCESTYHMLSEREFNLMKNGAFLINTAGGLLPQKIVDEKALIDALSSGKLAGAALDRFEKEPPDPTNPLLKMENVIVSPMWAYQVKSIDPDVCIAENIVKVFRGEMPTNVANPEVFKVMKKIGRTEVKGDGESIQ